LAKSIDKKARFPWPKPMSVQSLREAGVQEKAYHSIFLRVASQRKKAALPNVIDRPNQILSTFIKVNNNA
jgi:hypothetical protein